VIALEHPAAPRPRPWPLLLALAALAAAVLLAFWPSGGNALLDFDDAGYLTRNARVSHGLTLDGARWALTATVQSNWHPLTLLSHQADVTLFGLDARWHHRVNLLLHLANAVLFFLLLWRLAGRLWPAAAAAALWGAHPLRVEAVAWAAERKEVLALLFGLLALLAYRRYVARPGTARMGAVALCLALGLAAKPTLVTLPFALLLLDLWPLRRTGVGAPAGAPHAPWTRLLGEKLPLFALAAASCVVTYAVQSASGATSRLAHLPFPARAGNAVVSVARYLGSTLWPLDLAVFYPHPEHSWPPAAVAAAALLIAGVTAATLLALRRAPALAVGWLWFLGTLVPMLGLVQVGWQAMADRYTYLPHLGLIAGCVLAVRLATARHRALAAALTVAAVLALTLQSRAQTRTWRDDETLFRHALAVTRDNWFVSQQLGAILTSQRRVDEGRALLLESLRVKPGYGETWYNLGVGYILQDRPEQARRALRQAATLNPRDADTRANLGVAALSVGRVDEAVAELTEALRLNPRLRGVAETLAFARERQRSIRSR
jgi:Flp pilus assembly protein TadD